MRRLLLLVIAVTLTPACRRAAPPAPREEIQASALPAIAITEKKKLLFTYAAPGGAFESTTKLKEIPEDRRGWVRVVDLALKPDRRLDHELVYVADLRTPGKGGIYPHVVMSRSAFEAAATARAAGGVTDKPAPAGKSSGGKVILYSTSWCPACRTARERLTARGIPYQEKDIEKDPQAAAELLQKAKAAGISASGVPVLEVNGTLMQGFDEDRLNALLGEKK